MSLLTRLSFLLVVALSPALGFSVYTEIQARQSREAAMRDEALRLVRLVSSGHQMIIEGARQTLTALSGFAPDFAADRNSCRSRLTAVLRAFDRYRSLAVIAADGRMLCGIQLDGTGVVDAAVQPAIDTPLLAGVLARGGFLAGGHDMAPDRRTQYFAEPYRDSTGAIAGMVEAGLSLDWLQRQIDSLPLPPGSSAAIVGRDRTVLARRPDHAAYVGRQVPAEALGALGGASMTVDTARGLDGVTRLVGLSPFQVEPVDFAVAVGLDSDRVFPDFASANRREAELLVLGAALVVLLLGLSASRLIGRPVRQLLVAAGRWEQGDLTARSGLAHDRSEFGRLGAAFDAMAEAQLQREAALERIVAERTAALRDSEARFRGIFDSTFQFTSLLALDGTLLEANAAALAFGGVSAADVLHRPVWETNWWAGDPTRVARLRRGVEQAAGGVFVRYEVEVRGAGGTTALLDFSLKPMAGKDGDVVMLIAEGRDITERSRLQAQLAQAQKMEAVGQLTGGVAHDFNNMLQAVTGNLDLVQRLMEPMGETRVLRLVGNALHAAGRGARLTQQLLAFSRKQNLRPERVWVSRQAAGMGDLLDRAAGETIKVDLHTAPDLWPCLIDPSQFESALLNLVINARDAMPSGGTLWVVAVNVTLDASAAAALDAAPGDYVQVDVRDSGSGIPADLLPRIFEPFFTTKAIGKGSGLGLAMVHGFVRQSGGAVAISSTVGQGTTVSMYLPRDPRPVTDVPPPPPVSGAAPPFGAPPLDVLLVEDDPDVMDAMRFGLADAGHRVRVARDGPEALAALSAGGVVDLLISDLSLPGDLTGADVAVAARQRFPSVRVLFTSGHAAEDRAPEDDRLGGHEVLRKPFPNALLLQRVAGIAAELAEAGQPAA